MSRMNNTCRSLIIISRQNGWDPTQIDGGGDLPASYTPRESPYVTDSKPIAGVDSPHMTCGYSGPESKDWNAPDVGRERPDHTTNANPFPGMPGAKGR